MSQACKDRSCGAEDRPTCHPEMNWPRPGKTETLEDAPEVAAWMADNQQGKAELLALAIKLNKERDEARKELEWFHNSFNST